MTHAPTSNEGPHSDYDSERTNPLREWFGADLA